MPCAERRAAKRASSAKPIPELLIVDDLEVWVTRKNVKNLRLGVTPPDGRIEASIPHRFPQSDLEEFVRSKRAWLLAKQREIASSPMAAAEAATPQQVKEWRAVVEACVPALVKKWERVLGVKAKTIAYRNMKSRWGSCQPATGRICINTRLALYPPECLEYVVVHELAHLLVQGHSPKFWALVEACLPNYRQARAKLR